MHRRPFEGRHLVTLVHGRIKIFSITEKYLRQYSHADCPSKQLHKGAFPLTDRIKVLSSKGNRWEDSRDEEADGLVASTPK